VPSAFLDIFTAAPDDHFLTAAIDTCTFARYKIRSKFIEWKIPLYDDCGTGRPEKGKLTRAGQIQSSDEDPKGRKYYIINCFGQQR